MLKIKRKEEDTRRWIFSDFFGPYFYSFITYTVDLSLLQVPMKISWLCSLFQCLQAMILLIRYFFSTQLNSN